MDAPHGLPAEVAPEVPWPRRLQLIVETMREMSRQTDPQEMVRAYGRRMRELIPRDALVSLSRRDLDAPYYRITRFSGWAGDVNPWRDKDQLPLLEGGILGELLYGDEPRVIDGLDVSPDDPAYEFIGGHASLMAIPLFDRGVALNMVVLLQREPGAFTEEQLPEMVWISNLFGRATHNLVLSDEVQRSYQALDRELTMVAEIQRSLLPAELPMIPRLDLAAHYQTSRRAGGDYYDFFELAEGRYGLLIADVSGHGTPAAVMMAITHALAHSLPGPCLPPSALLARVNKHLACRYTTDNGTFVTAFYGIFDPRTRQFVYSNAGHHPPRLKRCEDGSITSLADAVDLPLGITSDVPYTDASFTLRPGDQLILFTDGITEARNPAGEFFGLAGVDRVLTDCRTGAGVIINSLLEELDHFTASQPPEDDRTVLVGRVS